MADKIKKRLLDALTACQAIGNFIAGLDFADYTSSLLIGSAVERQFEVGGGAIRYAENEDVTLIEQLPELRQIVGLGNRIIHGDDSVDDERIWKASREDIPALQARLASLLSREEYDE